MSDIDVRCTIRLLSAVPDALIEDLAKAMLLERLSRRSQIPTVSIMHRRAMQGSADGAVVRRAYRCHLKQAVECVDGRHQKGDDVIRIESTSFLKMVCIGTEAIERLLASPPSNQPRPKREMWELHDQ